MTDSRKSGYIVVDRDAAEGSRTFAQVLAFLCFVAHLFFTKGDPVLKETFLAVSVCLNVYFVAKYCAYNLTCNT